MENTMALQNHPTHWCQVSENGWQEPNSTTQKTVQMQKQALIKRGGQTRQKGKSKVQEGRSTSKQAGSESEWQNAGDNAKQEGVAESEMTLELVWQNRNKTNEKLKPGWSFGD